MFTIKSYFLPALSFFAPTRVPVKAPNYLPILNHVHVIRELKEQFIKKSYATAQLVPATKTPTLSYLKAAPKALDPMCKTRLEERRTKYADFIKPIIENEKKYCTNYYVFYHGQLSAFRVFQDFLKELYTVINIHHPIDEFEFMRMWHLAENELRAQSFIDEEEEDAPGVKWWFDSRADLMKNMMCVNFSLFGNMWWEGESSFYYFMKNQSAFVSEILISKLLNQIFAYYGLDQKYIEDLIVLNKSISTPEGNLMQIFMPKDKVDHYVYLSKPGGTPYRTKLDSTFDECKKRHTKISTILDKYLEDLSSLDKFDEFQGRLLLSRDCMLNPNSGVKIIRYTTVDKASMTQYAKALKKLTNTIFDKALKDDTFKNLDATGLGKLLELTKR